MYVRIRYPVYPKITGERIEKLKSLANKTAGVCLPAANYFLPKRYGTILIILCFLFSGLSIDAAVVDCRRVFRGFKNKIYSSIICVMRIACFQHQTKHFIIYMILLWLLIIIIIILLLLRGQLGREIFFFSSVAALFMPEIGQGLVSGDR